MKKSAKTQVIQKFTNGAPYRRHQLASARIHYGDHSHSDSISIDWLDVFASQGAWVIAREPGRYLLSKNGVRT